MSTFDSEINVEKSSKSIENVSPKSPLSPLAASSISPKAVVSNKNNKLNGTKIIEVVSASSVDESSLILPDIRVHEDLKYDTIEEVKEDDIFSASTTNDSLSGVSSLSEDENEPQSNGIKKLVSPFRFKPVRLSSGGGEREKLAEEISSIIVKKDMGEVEKDDSFMTGSSIKENELPLEGTPLPQSFYSNEAEIAYFYAQKEKEFLRNAGKHFHIKNYKAQFKQMCDVMKRNQKDLKHKEEDHEENNTTPPLPETRIIAKNPFDDIRSVPNISAKPPRSSDSSLQTNERIIMPLLQTSQLHPHASFPGPSLHRIPPPPSPPLCSTPSPPFLNNSTKHISTPPIHTNRARLSPSITPLQLQRSSSLKKPSPMGSKSVSHRRIVSSSSLSESSFSSFPMVGFSLPPSASIGRQQLLQPGGVGSWSDVDTATASPDEIDSMTQNSEFADSVASDSKSRRSFIALKKRAILKKVSSTKSTIRNTLSRVDSARSVQSSSSQHHSPAVDLKRASGYLT